MLKQLIVYKGKVRHLNLEELFLSFVFGRKVELLDAGDFSAN